MVVGQDRLAEQRLDDRRAEELGRTQQFIGGAEGAAAGKDGHLRRAIQQRRRAIEVRVERHVATVEPAGRRVSRHIALRAIAFGERLLLHVVGDRQMRDAAAGQRRTAGERRHVLHMRGIRHVCVEHRDIVEDAHQIDVLLCEGRNEIVILHAGDREDRSLVEFRVVQAGEKMPATRTRRAKADAEPARPLGVRACHEGCGFLVPDLNEPYSLLPRA
jgi:hypothetical protein